MAEMVMKEMVKKAGVSQYFEIDSAATSREEIGNGIHYGTREKLKEMGIPCGEHYARQINKKDYEYYDYLIIMDRNNARNLERIIGDDYEHKVYPLLSFANKNRDIADPWYTGNFDDTYHDVAEGCQALLNYLCDKGV